MTTIADTIAKIDFANAKAVAKFFTDLGATKSKDGVFVCIMRGGYAFGEVAKMAGNKPVDTDMAFSAYEAGRAMDGSEGPLTSAATRKTYRSLIETACGGPAMISHKESMEPVLDFICTKLSGGFGTRAKLAKVLFALSAKSVPTVEAMEKALPEDADANITDAVAAFVARLLTFAGDDDNAAEIVKHGLADDIKALIAKARDTEKAFASKVAKTPPKRKGGKVRSASAAALIA